MDLIANTKKWRQTLGELGESIASDYLTAKGFTVLERNFRVHRVGEIDLIATKDNTALVFAEVKTRMGISSADSTGQLAIDSQKQRKIISTALHFVESHQPTVKKRRILQFDVLLVDYCLTRGQMLSLLVADDLAMLRQHASVLHLPEAFGRFQ